MNLFRLGDFTLASGLVSRWKIDCDALTRDDWDALAAMAVERLPVFGRVRGVPTGGFPFAVSLGRYASGSLRDPLLIAEDVVTTGGSMERFRAKVGESNIVGVCVFARGPCPSWVTPLFCMTTEPK